MLVVLRDRPAAAGPATARLPLDRTAGTSRLLIASNEDAPRQAVTQRGCVPWPTSYASDPSPLFMFAWCKECACVHLKHSLPLRTNARALQLKAPLPPRPQFLVSQTFPPFPPSSPSCRHNFITDAGLTALVPSLARLPALLRLDLGSVLHLAHPGARSWPLQSQGGGHAWASLGGDSSGVRLGWAGNRGGSSFGVPRE